jgi:hypothetical protein
MFPQDSNENRLQRGVSSRETWYGQDMEAAREQRRGTDILWHDLRTEGAYPAPHQARPTEYLLVMRAPADRDQIRVAYRAAGNHEELVGHVIGIDGRLREWDAPPELFEFFRQLRAGMFKPGAGTWTGVSTVVEWPIRTSMNYLFTEDPRWSTPPSRADVLDELETFPRPPEHVPAWMRTILPNAEQVAAVAGRFRHARIFDHRDPQGRLVATHYEQRRFSHG